MQCPYCGLWTPPCPMTGYDGDEICPSCQDLKEKEEPEPGRYDDWATDPPKETPWKTSGQKSK